MEIKIHMMIDTKRDVECVIKGDDKIYEISCASVLAKIYRDEIIKILAKYYPEYEWEKNMGYGTKSHISAIKKHGATLFHRMTFIKKFI